MKNKTDKVNNKKKYSKTLQVDLPKHYKEFIREKSEIIIMNKMNAKFKEQTQKLHNNSYLCLNDL